jgi:EthD domain
MTRKLVVAAMPAAGVSLGELGSYWNGEFAKQVISTASELGICNFAVSSTLDSELNMALWRSRRMQPPLGGVVELWWSSDERLAKVRDDPAKRGAVIGLVERSLSMSDAAQSHAFVGEDHEITSPPADRPLNEDAIRVVYVTRRPAGVDYESFHSRWLFEHAEVVKPLTESARIRRYVQTHKVEDALGDELQNAIGLAEAPEGFSSAWFESLDDLRPGVSPESADAGRAMLEDERRFIDVGNSRCFVCSVEAHIGESPNSRPV